MIATSAETPIPPAHTTAGVDTAAPKTLTKKQKKALAFRDKSSRTKTKGKADTPLAKHHDRVEEDGLAQMANTDVTLMEESHQTWDEGDQIQVEGLEGKITESSRGRGEKAGEGKERADDARIEARERRGQWEKRQQGVKSAKSQNQERKRKREQLDDGVGARGVTGRKTKRSKGEEVEFGLDQDGEGQKKAEGETEEEVREEEGGVKKGKERQRFILFLGNLKFATTVDTIKTHFSACDPLPEVRLLTPKTSPTGKTTSKSKGCAFLEFTSRSALQQALKLHHSMLEGRMINVELTAGGGGKGEKRMEKVRERNKALLGQRKNRADKESKDGSFPSRPDKPQRYSTTSGIEQSSLPKNRTWSIGNITEDEVHRGGKKHKKTEKSRGSRKPRGKDWATGVNAIPVS